MCNWPHSCHPFWAYVLLSPPSLNPISCDSVTHLLPFLMLKPTLWQSNMEHPPFTNVSRMTNHHWVWGFAHLWSPEHPPIRPVAPPAPPAPRPHGARVAFHLGLRIHELRPGRRARGEGRDDHSYHGKGEAREQRTGQDAWEKHEDL